jgi:hypothetical protein
VGRRDDISFKKEEKIFKKKILDHHDEVKGKGWWQSKQTTTRP